MRLQFWLQGKQSQTNIITLKSRRGCWNVLKKFNIYSILTLFQIFDFFFKPQRKNKLTIDSHDFEMASERVLAGLEKKKIVSEEERKVVAVHESGHAVASWFLEGGHPLLKVKLQSLKRLYYHILMTILLSSDRSQSFRAQKGHLVSRSTCQTKVLLKPAKSFLTSCVLFSAAAVPNNYFSER